MKYCVNNVKIISENEIIENKAIYIENNKIIAVKPFENEEDFKVIDGKGMYASTGFIEVHSHGAGGCDVLDPYPEAFIETAKMHGQHGTTLIMPTITSCANQTMLNSFEYFRQAKKMNYDGAAFLGLHLEGPYFSEAQRGGQGLEYIKSPREDEYKMLLDSTDDIVRWSAAPELDEGFKFGEYITSKGILCAVGHSDATYEVVKEAFNHGYTHITHLYSGTSMVHRINAFRYAGVVESAYLIDDMTVEIIADGCHLPKSLLQMVYKLKGTDKTCLTSDSVWPAGLTYEEIKKLDEKTKNKDQNFIIEDGVAKMPDRSAFMGSIATGDKLVRNMVKLAEVPLVDAIKMATLTPARIMKIDDYKGRIKEGYDADVVIFDDDINIKYVFVNGKIIREA